MNLHRLREFLEEDIVLRIEIIFLLLHFSIQILSDLFELITLVEQFSDVPLRVTDSLLGL